MPALIANRPAFGAPLSRRSLIRGGAGIALGAVLAGLPFSRALLAHDVAQAWPNAAALAEKYLGEKKVANLFMTFGWGDEEHAHTVGGGKLGIGPSASVDEDTLYRIYSMTKPITGMATMMCIEDGLIGLDMPLGEILPAFAEMQVLVDPEGPLDNTVPAAKPITIRQLLTHTAGLGYIITAKGPLLDAYVDQGIVGGRVSRFPIPGVPNPVPAPGLEEWANRLAKLPLMYQPASRWSYSASIDLLGRVIEVASGKPFETFLQERLFQPLGMTSTFMQVPQSEKARLADNYGILNGAVLPIDTGGNSIFLDAPKVPSGGGGLVSSPHDYDRFLRMILNYGMLDDVRVMSEASVRLGTSNLLPPTADLKGTWMEGMGHGAGGRSVNDTFGWGGAAGTLAAVDFNLGLRTAMWTQYMPSEAYGLRDEYLAAIAADTAKKRAAKAA